MDLEHIMLNEISQKEKDEYCMISLIQIINAGEGVEKRELLYTVDENVNWYSHYGKHYGGSSKN